MSDWKVETTDKEDYGFVKISRPASKRVAVLAILENGTVTIGGIEFSPGVADEALMKQALESQGRSPGASLARWLLEAIREQMKVPGKSGLAGRPTNYGELSAREQWDIDKALGCLDD